MIKIFKQPNGKYCYFSYNGMEKINLTEQDIKEIYISKAEAESEDAIKNAENYGGIIKELFYRNSNSSCDVWLKQIGFTESYENLIKYIPRKPLHQIYASSDFTTYALCPYCNEHVQNGMGFIQKQCKCGQMLQWD